MTRMSSGSKAFRAYMANHQEPCDNIRVSKTHIKPDESSITEENDNISFHTTGLVEYTHQPEQNDNLQYSEKSNHHLCTDTSNEEQTAVADRGSVTHDFSLEIPNLIPDEREPRELSAQDELLWWHYHLNHLPFKRLLKMPGGGILPRKLLRVKESMCPACQYGKMHRRPWQSKGRG